MPLNPVPSFALPFIGDEAELRRLGLKFNPLWLKWFLDTLQAIQTGGAVDHNSLTGLQGGTTSEFYHLTSAEHSSMTGNTPATTVTDETTFGIAKAVGTGTHYAREDHTHGSPTNPLTAHLAAGDPHSQYALDSDLAAYQPLDSDLTAIAALATTSFGRALLVLADAAALRTAAALGTAATQNTTAFDAAGAAAAAQAASQPLDSDLTAIAALSTTSFGRALLVLADASALRTAAALGTAAVENTSAFDAAGAAAAAQAASQPLDSDLTAIAAVITTAFGRALLALADAAALRTAAALGTLATQDGTFSGTSSGTNTGDQTTISGNAGTATALQTARNINGVSFNGTADITVQPPLARVFLMMGA